MQKINETYFGIQIQEDSYILESDIKKLPFYQFWKDSASGSTCLVLENDTGIYITDWELFCKYFIKSGKHRYQK